MDLIAISDTHIKAQKYLSTELEKLYTQYPDAILIHAGDALNHGSYKEANVFLDWYHALPFKHKLFVPGNHDFCFDLNHKEMQSYLKINKELIAKDWPSVTMLINETIEIAGKVFGGLCMIPDLPNWAFYMPINERARLLNIFPKVDVLINHAPLDEFPEALHYTYSGDQMCRLYCMANKVETYICGHIHEKHGLEVVDGSVNRYNVSILDEKYDNPRKPTIITI